MPHSCSRGYVGARGREPPEQPLFLGDIGRMVQQCQRRILGMHDVFSGEADMQLHFFTLLYPDPLDVSEVELQIELFDPPRWTLRGFALELPDQKALGIDPYLALDEVFAVFVRSESQYITINAVQTL